MDVTPSPGSTPGSTPGRRGRGAARVVAVAALTLATAAVATGAFGPTARPAAADGLRAFDGCGDLRDWYVDALRPLVGPYGLGGGWGYASDTAGGAERATAAQAAPGEDAGGTGGAVGNGATGTNLQEAGVDEPDVMKTADGRLYTTSGDRLVVIDVTSGTPREVGSVQVPALRLALGGWGYQDGVPADTQPVPAQPGTAELLLDGDRVLLLSSAWVPAADQPPGQGQGADRMWPGPSGTSTTTTTVVDVADPSSPRVVSQQEVEGSVVGARLSGGVVRVVTTSTPTLAPAEVPQHQAFTPAWETEATKANLLALERMDGEDFLPQAITRDADGAVVGRAPAVACDQVAHPGAGAGAGTITVRSLDLDAGDPEVSRTAVAADGDLVYASADRLYVATTRGGWTAWTGARVAGQEVPQVEEVTTELHGFDTGDGAATTYLASGEVDGFLLGRWALSARDGRLRVATTVGEVWASDGGQPASESFVTVLAESGGRLVQEGRVGGLGKGETIRAVRWFDDVATVVTFRQTDPLYVVDLSDPAAPAVTGELKVPGYSAYLHPVGDGRLVGIGQDATDEGRTTGVLVQTFDVSDPTSPTQEDTWTEADTWTSVEGDSRQFSYLPDQRTVMMPLDTAGGAAVQTFSVGEDGSLAEAGRYALGTQDYRWLARAMPVGDAVALLTGGNQGTSVTLLDVRTMDATGTVALD